MGERKNSWRWGRDWARAVFLGALGAMATTAACGDDTTTCLAYACSTAVSLAASVPCAEAAASFAVALCNGDDCSNAVIEWSREGGRRCTDNLAPLAGESGIQQTRTVCAEAQEQAIVFTGAWDTGTEGIPSKTTYRLRIADGATGDVLIDESANGDFEPSESYDDCHACYHAEIDLGTSASACSPGS